MPVFIPVTNTCLLLAVGTTPATPPGSQRVEDRLAVDEVGVGVEQRQQGQVAGDQLLGLGHQPLALGLVEGVQLALGQVVDLGVDIDLGVLGQAGLGVVDQAQ